MSIRVSDEVQSLHVEDQSKNQKHQEDEDEQVLKFMDSLDSYLVLLDSLSSTLRQGWFELASARQSMGASRINGALLDLKHHPASTSLEVAQYDEEAHFSLCKWTSSRDGDSREKQENNSQQKSNGLHQRHKGMSQLPEPQEESLPVSASPVTADEQVQKERFKSLAVFGKLVSPKLRAAQLSFETALETIVEVANVRSSLLFSYDQVRKHMDDAKEQ